jgi:hypothetical protein
MKKCVPSSSTSCFTPIAECSPTCSSVTNPSSDCQHCTIIKDKKYTWLEWANTDSHGNVKCTDVSGPGTPTPTTSPTAAAPITVPPQAGGSSLSQAQIDAVVAKHNTLRAGMGASDMMMLTWDPDLASRAQQHSSTCPGSSHSTNRGSDGENMAAQWSSNFQLTSATDLTPSVQRWYDEIGDAGPYQNGGIFSGFQECTAQPCGHYTQVVWAGANKIGCGVTSCPGHGMPGYQLTCQYSSTIPGRTGGNMIGSVIFTKGKPCAACPSGSCTSPALLCS